MKSLLTFSLLIALEVNARKECIPKYIDNSSKVCVCNNSYCDDLPPIIRPTDPTVVLVFESNQIGDRFKQTILKTNVKLRKQLNSLKSQTITMDKGLQYQRIKGFGGAFTDTTGMLLKSVPESLATAIIEGYFSPNGIEYSFGRVPIAGTDYSVRPYTYADAVDDKQLQYFALQNEDFQWKIPYIKLAQNVSRHQIKLFGTSWSPPAWMKVDNDIRSFTNLKGEPGGEYYQIWANYLVKFLEAYRSNGIEFWGLTVQNEPAQDHQINGLNMTATQQRDFIKLDLGPTLTRAGFDKSKLNLLIFDETSPYLREWVDTILSDSESAQYISGIAMHWYYNQILGPFPDIILDYVYQNYAQYFLINSEACSLTGAGHGKWAYAQNYAYDIIRDLNHWVTAWVEWNMALDMNGGPTWMEKHGCGGPVYIDPVAGEAYKQPTYYALAHFGKFIPPDSVRVYRELSEQIESLSVLTVKRPDNASVVIVLNTSDEEFVININDSNDNHISHTISGHSIQSYIWWHKE